MPSVKFQSRFAPLVQVGQKTQTIRPERKRPIKVGDRLLLDTWKGKPYRSKVRRLGEGVVVSVLRIQIGLGTLRHIVHLDGTRLMADELLTLARADGFRDAKELLDWFEETHRLPFSGVVISWMLKNP